MVGHCWPAASRVLNRQRVLVWVVLSLAALVALTEGTAWAHAVLLSSRPGDREQLSSPPSEVILTFSEAVSMELGGIKVFAGDGARVDAGSTDQPRPDQLRVGLHNGLDQGTYVVNYRVISADGHPVSGALAFSVGAPVDERAAATLTPTASRSSELVGIAGRFLAYAGGLLASGLAVFVTFAHAGVDDLTRFNRIILGAAAAALLGQLLVIIAQASLATGSGLAVIGDAETVFKALRGELGWSSALLIVGLAAAIGASRVGSEIAGQSVAFNGLLATAIAYGVWGHTTVAPHRWLVISSDVVHAATAATWFGGLVGIVVVLRSGAATADEARRGSGLADLAEAATTVSRFSTIATVSIVLLVVAGFVLSWSELGSLRALFSSTYGRSLLVKIGVAAVVIGLGAFNHFRLVPAVVGETGEYLPSVRQGWRRLRVTVSVEAAALVLVLLVTAVLVNLTPGRSATDAQAVGPVELTKPLGPYRANLLVTPAMAGRNSLHIQILTTDGRPVDVGAGVTIELRLPDRDIGPLRRNATYGGTPGHFVLEDASDLSIPGTWEVTLIVAVSRFEEQSVSFAVPIGSPRESTE
ncbi:MAG: copper resistance protein CopC [Acidimicrobiales bacterium]|nr:copper resistance protein CopC [Acidimicrobiales bacterium]